VRHAQAAGALPGAVRDPFDRMLIVQAAIGGMQHVSNATAFDAYAIKRLW
jgi:PIN domain nuclease of toxin-antitoxin system